MTKLKFKVEGMKELERSLKKLGKVPQKHVTSSAKKGMNISLKDSRANAPYDTGMLKKGIKLAGERSKVKGKKVYRIVFNKAYNSEFQKPVKNPQRKSTKNGIAYYPVSMEYGFFDKKGRFHQSSNKTGWIVGFVHSALTDNTVKIEKTMVDNMKKKIDAEIAKVGLK